MIPDKWEKWQMKLTHKGRTYQIINNYFWEVRFCVYFVFFAFCISSPKFLKVTVYSHQGGGKRQFFSKKLLLNFELSVILNQIRVS